MVIFLKKAINGASPAILKMTPISSLSENIYPNEIFTTGKQNGGLPMHKSIGHQAEALFAMQRQGASLEVVDRLSPLNRATSTMPKDANILRLASRICHVNKHSLSS